MRSEASRQNIAILILDAKLRFALLASLRSAIFSEIRYGNYLVTFPARVKNIIFEELFLGEFLIFSICGLKFEMGAGGALYDLSEVV